MTADRTFIPTFLQELPLARSAVEYATGLHAGQRRDSDAAPSLLHPLEVAALLHNAGYDETVVTAGVLHDTLEDTSAESADIRLRFGDPVADLVRALTEDPRIESFAERKAALRRQVSRFGPRATAVYAADKIAKVRELRAHAAHEPAVLTAGAGRRRIEHYHQSLEMLEFHAADHPLVRQLRFELEALCALPPRSG